MHCDTKNVIPYFSIVIPMYNREKEIVRALDSCLKQTLGDFEVVIVDDCSTDESVKVVESYTDPRFHLVRHEINRGVCPARNSGVDVARSEWILFLDSDDELLPEALSVIQMRSKEATEEIGRLWFMNRLDSGQISPDPPLGKGIVDYDGYVMWCVNVQGPTDTFAAVRKSALLSVKFPETRATEALYQMNFAREFKTMTFPDFVNIVHSDARMRYSNLTTENLLLRAYDESIALDELVLGHGDFVRGISQDYYRRVLGRAGIYCLLAGRRRLGTKYMLQHIRFRPLVPTAWAALLIGLFGPHYLAKAMVSRSNRTE